MSPGRREFEFKWTVANGDECEKSLYGGRWGCLFISRFSVRVRGGSPQNQVQIPNGRSDLERPFWLFDTHLTPNVGNAWPSLTKPMMRRVGSAGSRWPRASRLTSLSLVHAGHETG